MHTAVVCQSRSQARLVSQALKLSPEGTVVAVESAALERTLKRDGFRVMRGRISERALYRELLPARQLIVLLKDVRRLRRLLDAVRRDRGDTPVLVLSMEPLARLNIDPADYPWAHVVSIGDKFRAPVRVDVRLARAKILVRQLNEVLGDAKNVLVLMQDDPDPDGLACALALRTLLGRTRVTMPMASFGRVTRPENLAMLSVLDLQVEQVSEDDLGSYDRIAMVDTQPPHLRVQLPRVDVVIDHHPSQTSYTARFKDVRNSYGATATILLEYLRAEGIKVNERLATALMYAIRADTLLLERPVCEADIEAFTWLFPKTNVNWIRRIERPALPRETLVSFAEGLRRARIEERVIFSHLGSVSREDIVPQLADFCLQVEDVDWSAVSGISEQELVISVRNVGFVQRAGAAVKAAFGEFGSAGGHRSMAKAVIPLENLPGGGAGDLEDEVYRMLEDRFLASLRGEEVDAGVDG